MVLTQESRGFPEGFPVKTNRKEHVKVSSREAYTRR